MIRTVLLVVSKEVRVAFRDRQTLIYVVVLPLVMYPALFWVLLQAMSLIEGQRAAATLELAVVAEAGAEQRRDALLDELGLTFEVASVAEDGAPAASDDGADENEGEASFVLLEAPSGDGDPRALLEGSLAAESEPRADVALWIPAGEGPLEILFDGARARSKNARSRLEEQLEGLSLSARAGALAASELPPTALSRIDFRPENLSSSSEIGAFAVSLMLPMMIVLMAVMGAFYPAVDVTAGERERKTEETTLLAPVPRLTVQLGKLIAVSTASGLATAVNLLGMGLAAGHLLSMLGGREIGFSLDWVDVALVAPFALPMVIFVSAALTAVASLAETFKQGQSLLGAAQMVFIFPAIASSLPGLELTPGIACTPIVGVAIAFRTILRGGPLAELPWGGLALCAASLLVYAALAVMLTVRLMDAELSTGGETSLPQRLRQALLGPR